MIDDSCKIDSLNKIISSKIFSNVEQYTELIKFLVHSEINHTSVKEYTIGMEIFKKGKEFNPTNDPSVRIFMHRLRNKIKSYYETEGKTDKVILTIPKGHYEVRFQQRSLFRQNITQWLLPQYIILIGIIISLFIINLLTVRHYKSIRNSLQTIDNPIAKDDPIWADFFGNQLPATIVIGDHFQFWEFDAEIQKSRIIIDYGINTTTAFEGFSNQFSNRNLKKERHGGLPMNCAWNIYDLTHVLNSFNQQADLELSSLFMATEFDLKNMVDRNIIYIGGFRNLREFNTVLTKLPIEYKYTDTFKGIITVREPDTDSLFNFVGKKLDNQYHQDIGLIAKLKGSNNENYLFLVGFAFPAQIETVRLLSRKDLLSKVYSQLQFDKPSFPKQFFLIIEIICTEFSAMETNVKYFREIPAKQQN
jgi:hypothetical protein